MSRIRVALALDDNALDKVVEVVCACRALGFVRDATLTGVGVFTGSIEADRLDALRAIPGVAAVEVERGMRVHRSPHGNVD
jgi:hypothetical protein